VRYGHANGALHGVKAPVHRVCADEDKISPAALQNPRVPRQNFARILPSVFALAGLDLLEIYAA
jgi:hypothetical protein